MSNRTKQDELLTNTACSIMSIVNKAIAEAHKCGSEEAIDEMKSIVEDWRMRESGKCIQCATNLLEELEKMEGDKDE